MINPGLGRIARLLKNTTLPWRAIHVAGTNGKGSVCAYVSAMLKAGNVPAGRFTSPHLIDRWDCITIDEQVIDEGLFLETESNIAKYNETEGIGASEFELLTATAFTLFAQQKITIGVVEVGMGGAEDATNVIQDPLVTVITRIGLDHQAFLGNTVEEITRNKAGIIKSGVPCVVDGTNLRSIVAEIQKKALGCNAGSLIQVPQDCREKQARIWSVLSKDDYEDHQQIHISLAYEALSIALHSTHVAPELLRLLPAIRATTWPGRLQTISIEELTGRTKSILLDGAHNLLAAEVLQSYVDRNIRQTDQPVTWVIALSDGKPVGNILSCLLKPHDRLVACEFGDVAGMPWVKPMNAQAIVSAAKGIGIESAFTQGKLDIVSVLDEASRQSKGGPIVVAGSLYLVSDVLRVLRDITRQRR